MYLEGMNGLVNDCFKGIVLEESIVYYVEGLRWSCYELRKRFFGDFIYNGSFLIVIYFLDLVLRSLSKEVFF